MGTDKFHQNMAHFDSLQNLRDESFKYLSEFFNSSFGLNIGYLLAGAAQGMCVSRK